MRIDLNASPKTPRKLGDFPTRSLPKSRPPASPVHLALTKYAIQYLARQNGYCKFERSLGFGDPNSTAQGLRLHDMWERPDRETQLRALVRTRMVFQNGMK